MYCQIFSLALDTFVPCSALHLSVHLGKSIGGFHDNTFATREEFRRWLFSEDGAKKFGSFQHTSSPFVFISADDNVTVIGGCDDLAAFAATMMADDAPGRLPAPPPYSDLDEKVRESPS